MKRISDYKIFVLSLVVATAGLSVTAYAQESTLSEVDVSGYVGTADPVEVAGLLNYCTENHYVEYDDAFQVLQSYNKKVNAVPDGQEGNVNYARGTAGQLLVSGKIYSLPTSVMPVREKACKAVLARAKASL